jgi:hypothetical protein
VRQVSAAEGKAVKILKCRKEEVESLNVIPASKVCTCGEEVGGM